MCSVPLRCQTVARRDKPSTARIHEETTHVPRTESAAQPIIPQVPNHHSTYTHAESRAKAHLTASYPIAKILDKKNNYF